MPKLYFGNLKCVKEASEWDDYMPEKVEQHCREQIEIASEVDFETFLKNERNDSFRGNFWARRCMCRRL